MYWLWKHITVTQRATMSWLEYWNFPLCQRVFWFLNLKAKRRAKTHKSKDQTIVQRYNLFPAIKKWPFAQRVSSCKISWILLYSPRLLSWKNYVYDVPLHSFWTFVSGIIPEFSELRARTTFFVENRGEILWRFPNLCPMDSVGFQLGTGGFNLVGFDFRLKRCGEDLFNPPPNITPHSVMSAFWVLDNIIGSNFCQRLYAMEGNFAAYIIVNYQAWKLNFFIDFLVSCHIHLEIFFQKKYSRVQHPKIIHPKIPLGKTCSSHRCLSQKKTGWFFSSAK